MDSWPYLFTSYVIQIYDFLIKHKETQAKHAPVYFKRRPRTFSGNQQKVQNLFVFALRFSGRKAWNPLSYKRGSSNLRIMRKHKKLENVLPNKYYVLTSFLTDFCTNPLCPKRVAIFLQWNGELTVPFNIVREANIEYIDYHICSWIFSGSAL